MTNLNQYAKTIAISDGSGTLTRLTDLPSQHTTWRTVDIWLPPGYGDDAQQRFPVVYLHDGQNMFDPALSNTAIDWGVDEAILRLASSGRARPAILVGIWCSPMTRWRDFMPQKALDGPAAGPDAERRLKRFVSQQGGPPISDGYLRFLVTELKPLVDARLRSLPGPGDTFLMGSSMGGLASLYALEQYPEVFGGAACLSTHWPAGGNRLVDFLAMELPTPGKHRLYFDYGSIGLDNAYAPFQRRMDGYLRAAGYREGEDWITRRYAGADHHEAAWRARVEVPLEFLLGKA